MNQNKKKRLIITGIIILIAAGLLYINLTKESKEPKALSLNEATFFKVENSDGEVLHFTSDQDKKAIKDALGLIQITPNKKETPSRDFIYRIQSTEAFSPTYDFEIFIGGNQVNLNSQKSDTGFLLENDSSFISLMDAYFSPEREINVGDLLKEREIYEVRAFSGLSGDQISYTEKTDIDTLIKIVSKETLVFDDYSNDGKAGADMSLTFYSEADEILLVYAGGNFSYIIDNNNNVLSPYYLLKNNGYSTTEEVHDFTGLVKIGGGN